MGTVFQAAKRSLPAPLKGALRDVLGWASDARRRRAVRALGFPHAQSAPVREAVENLLDEIKIEQVVREAAPRFRALAGRKGLKLHLGAGDDIKSGWVNIDLALRHAPEVERSAHPDTAFINYDLRRGLPLEDESCDYIYSSHFLEHLEYRHGLALMRECHRVLQPGGLFRAALPNFKGLFDAYLRRDDEYLELVNLQELLPEVEPATLTLVDHINYGVYQYGEHKCIYDEEKITLVLGHIGFSAVRITPYKEGVDPSDPLRRKYSFYVEADK
jgi:SAM-dependent methyltransferase